SASEVNVSPTGLSGPAMAQGIKDRIADPGPSVVVALVITFVAGALGGLWLARRKRGAAWLSVLAATALSPTPRPTAPEGEDHGALVAVAQPNVPRDIAQLLADGSVFVPKSTQRILAIRTILTQPSVYRRTIELPGRIIPDPNASGYVQAVVGGRLSPPE